MATMTSRSQHPTAFDTSYASARRIGHHSIPSPTESNFSDSLESQDAIRRWDEVRVAEWLRTINCAQYVDLFKQNNINGENLLEMDQATLKEMGVNKVGDRVRMAAQAKQFRNSCYQRASKRTVNRQSLALLDNNTLNGSVSPPAAKTHSVTASRVPPAPPSRSDKRMSRRFDFSDSSGIQPASRPSSPLIDKDAVNMRAQRPSQVSPKDAVKNGSYFVRSGTDNSLSLRSAPAQIKSSPSVGSFALADKALIRVVYNNGKTSVVSIRDCVNAEEITARTLKKQQLNENHARSYCFYVLDGTRPDPSKTRRLDDAELVRVCKDQQRNERGRLILRSVHLGEPDGEQLRVAVKLAEQDEGAILSDTEGPRSAHNTGPKRRLKAEAILGESLPSATYPMSPASKNQRDSYFQEERAERAVLGRTVSSSSTASSRAQKQRDMRGDRPPTELITQDLTSYFPDVEKDEMDRTVRMSIRRSQRLSRAWNRMSTASNLSFASSLKDAPPLPTIADTWFNAGGNADSNAGSPNTGASSTRPVSLRPLSVIRLGRPQSRSNYRESMASSMLERLDEESPLNGDRDSLVSFGDNNSGSDSLGGTISGQESSTMLHSAFDDGSSPSQTEAGGSLNSCLSRALAEDGEGDDAELMDHLEKDSWEDLRYMKGSMIGQGSFGTVYLALHAITGELMALKQVEMPSSANTAMDAKKNNMVEALKREIDLLRELKHPNIVQYLGSNSDDTHLNIFLEYVAGGSVATMLTNYGPLPEALICNFVRQILTGLAYLHSMDIIHRDIKGANILVDNHGSVKISDFGISKRVETTIRTSMARQPKKGGARVSLQGSVFWMAPEVVKQTAYTRKADIWSLGCLIVEMFTGTHPHPNCSQLQAIFKIGGKDQAKPEVPDHLSKDVKDFLAKTFEYNHELRPSAEELLNFAFVAAKPTDPNSSAT